MIIIEISGQSVPPLINYQGRLTDQSGAPLTAGLYGIQFRLWDSPLASGTNDLIWGQQFSNLAVQSNGVFSVILGSPGGSAIQGATPAVNNLAYAFASSNVFLGVTVTVSNGAAVVSPSEILPRQQLLSVPFALSAATAGSAINASNATIAAMVVPGSISSQSLAIGAVTLTNLATRIIGPSVGVGGIGLSPSCGSDNVLALSLNLTTSGRPVFVSLIPDSTVNQSYIGVQCNAGQTIGYVNILRDGSIIATSMLLCNANAVSTPPAVATTIDFAPPGPHSYSVTIVPLAGSANNKMYVYYSKLVAFEF